MKKKEIKRTIIKTLKTIVIGTSFITLKATVYATTLEESTLVVGTQNLVQAIISWLTGISLTVCGGYFIYYVYCLKTNDEGERRRNIQNIKTTLIAMIVITCGLALIDTILGFYK